MLSRLWVSAVALSLALIPLAPASHFLSTDQKEVVSVWLHKHLGYRLANEKDCACDEDCAPCEEQGTEEGGSRYPTITYILSVVTSTGMVKLILQLL